MHVLQLCLAAAAVVRFAEAAECHSFPSSTTPFTSGFSQPEPPLVKPEFGASFIQHKWDLEVTNIAAGYMVNSPSQGIVSIQITSKIGLESSKFDYANVTNEGLVDNTVTTYDVNSESNSTVWRDYVNSNFPIFGQTILIDNSAVYAGLAQRRITEGLVAAWNIMYQGTVPVTIYVDNCNVVVGYDYFSSARRTRVITEFFNIQIEEPSVRL